MPNPDYSNQVETPVQATEPAAPQQAQPDQFNPDSLLDSINIAEQLDDEELTEIGQAVFEGYERDDATRKTWCSMVDEYVKLAAQVKEAKSWPWQKAANVKYPLLSTAALQFQARAYPSLVPSDGKIVNMKVVGMDPQGKKALLADKLAKHMNYQLLKEMKDWEEETDRLLIQLPIVGCLFRKTYFDQIKKRNVSRLLGAKDLVVNYWAPSLEGAYRKTEIITMTKNEVQGMINAGVFLDVDLPEPESPPKVPEKTDIHKGDMPSQMDRATPYIILEQHTFWDLDDDGIDEPYIITIESQTRKVLRMVARYDSDGAKRSDDKKIICFEPVEYYTKYEFLPNPDGGFYGVGFGHLLGPLNDSANTIINQLLDAGTLSNLQSGFLGKGLRLKPGETRLAPGEWRNVPTAGDDIKKQIFPLPVKEPSKVLFELLGLIIQSTKELASVAEIFVGKMPGQNTPATTTMATIEQGMKVFTSIYKRVYRSLTDEFEKIFRLNSIHPENLESAPIVLDEPISAQDYDRKSYDVCPTADPTAVSSTQKLLKAQGLMELLPLGTISVVEVTRRILEAQEQPNIEALMQQPQPQVDPKVQAAQVKMQQDQEKHKLDMVMKQFDMQMKQQEAMMNQKFMQMEKMMEFKLKEMEMQQDARHSQQKHMMQTTQMLETAHAKREAQRVAGPSGNTGAKNGSNGSSGNSQKQSRK